MEHQSLRSPAPQSTSRTATSSDHRKVSPASVLRQTKAVYSPREIDRMIENRRIRIKEAEIAISQNEITTFEEKNGIKHKHPSNVLLVPPTPKDDPSIPLEERIRVPENPEKVLDSVDPVYTRLFTYHSQPIQRIMNHGCPFCCPEKMERSFSRPSTASAFSAGSKRPKFVQRVSIPKPVDHPQPRAKVQPKEVSEPEDRTMSIHQWSKSFKLKEKLARERKYRFKMTKDDEEAMKYLSMFDDSIYRRQKAVEGGRKEADAQ